ncbi:hypothetical protein CVS40_4844 [Lucilia cuprina]|nr:hypothetical protein CVS40_4844 [Lucilia cuprina]
MRRQHITFNDIISNIRDYIDAGCADEDSVVGTTESQRFQQRGKLDSVQACSKCGKKVILRAFVKLKRIR